MRPDKNNTTNLIISIFKTAVLLVMLSLFVLNAISKEVKSVSLSGNWKVTWSDGVHGRMFKTIGEFPAEKDMERYIDVRVPMDLNLAMVEKGIINDPCIGTNSLHARWISQQYWSYYKTFQASDDMIDSRCWLVFERLDYAAIVYLNGKEIARHENAFLPCRVDISEMLKKGENTLSVGIESGFYSAAEKKGSDYLNPNSIEVVTKRIWLRKPQYQYGWDWNPVMINVGITGDVRLEWTRKARIDQVLIQTTLTNNLNTATIQSGIIVQAAFENTTVEVRSTVAETNQTISQKVLLNKEFKKITTNILLTNPKLWWPSGHGEQNFYHIRTEIVVDNEVADAKTDRIGIRKVEIDQSKHPVEGNYFTIIVNNRKIFCKGANYVPADMIYSSISKDKINVLIDFAKEANFNMLRIWGGGDYAPPELLNLCDEEGIMVWHDFPFAYAKYPGEDREFTENIREEIKWAVRKLSGHPSLCVWCGNNEVFEGWNGSWWKSWGKMYTDFGIYLQLIPEILKQEAVTIPYWPGSPYNVSYSNINSPFMGDQHPWNVMLKKDSTNFYKYRTYVDRFADEGGILGASSISTLKQFLPEKEQYVRSFTWEHHDNLVSYFINDLGLTYQMTDDWLEKNYKELSFEEYAFASSLLQAEGLKEYINNYRRRMFSSSAAIFWMYNDSWPVAHGWSIIDYYNRKKLAFYTVRKAFQNVNVIIDEDKDSYLFYGVNDGLNVWNGNLNYGLFTTNGTLTLDKWTRIKLPPNASTLLVSISKKQLNGDNLNKLGAFAQLYNPDKTLKTQQRYFSVKFKELDWHKPDIKISRDGKYVVFESKTFVWGACIDLNGDEDIPDNCFDVIPGKAYSTEWPVEKKLPEILKTGNQIFKEYWTDGSINTK